MEQLVGPTCSTKQQCWVAVAESTNDTSQKYSTTKDAVEQQLKGMANWKPLGLNKVHTFWIKNFTKLHGRVADSSSSVLQWKRFRVDGVRKNKLGCERWIKGNYRPIPCLPTTFKLLTCIRTSYSLTRWCSRIVQDTYESKHGMDGLQQSLRHVATLMDCGISDISGNGW